jgi:membrane-bound lytic murein transglycosylase B
MFFFSKKKAFLRARNNSQLASARPHVASAAMISRRFVLATPLLACAMPARAADKSFAAFVASIRAEAVRAGIRGATVDAAFQGVQPNPKVLAQDHSQPEFTLTWAQYRDRVLPAARLAKARTIYAQEWQRLAGITARYPADPRIVMGIWGLESGFGEHTGRYRIVESLGTLAFRGRRTAYFRGELINALRILDAGDIAPAAMTGSWAGAMGQPQFMPSSYLRYAVDADGDGRRDIWTDRADVFGSVANYLAKSGWRMGEPWGQQIRVPPTLNPSTTGRDRLRTLGEWQAQGVTRIDGTGFSRGDVRGAVLMPDGAGGDAFMVYGNFNAIRRYNPSDYYALAVGLLAYAVT